MSDKKYKRIYLEDEEGNVEFAGLKEDKEDIKLVKHLNDGLLTKIKHKNQTDYWFKEFGGYIHMHYLKNQLLLNEIEISRANISRLIYLATYIEYNYKEENLLVRKRVDANNVKHLKKSDLKKILKLSPNAFREFINEMKELEILFEVDDKFYLNNKYFSKGKCEFKDGEYARIFINTTQMLYENCTPRQHKQLSYVYQLLPFLNFDTNILCSNPHEHFIGDLNKLSLNDICDILGVDNHNKKKLENDLLKFYITLNGKKYHLFSEVMIRVSDGWRNYFVINPAVIYKGRDSDRMKEMINYLFFED